MQWSLVSAQVEAVKEKKLKNLCRYLFNLFLLLPSSSTHQSLESPAFYLLGLTPPSFLEIFRIFKLNFYSFPIAFPIMFHSEAPPFLLCPAPPSDHWMPRNHHPTIFVILE